MPRHHSLSAGLDEAFVDFWTDTLLDPITPDWPPFVVCKLKHALVPDLTFGIGEEATKNTLKWLSLEQVYSVKPHPIGACLVRHLCRRLARRR
jgi:hypothetical protein